MRYAIKVSKTKNQESNIKGFATVTFGDSFKITNIAILENKGKGELFVTMPRYKSNERDEHGNTVYKDICNPVTKEFREELYGNILKTFDNISENPRGVMETNRQDKEMPGIKVTVTPYEQEGSSIRGFARVVLNDSFVIGNISILQGKSNVFVAMPSYKTKQTDENGKPIYQDVCYPVTREFREKLYGEILETYKKEKEKNRSELQDRMKNPENNTKKEEFIEAPDVELPFR